MHHPVVLITGGASGLGYELAKLFAADGFSLILASRNEINLKKAQAELSEQYRAAVEIIVADLTELLAPINIFFQIKERGWKIDILVNNAGFGLLGNFAELSLQKQSAMINLNISALTSLTWLFLEQAPENAKILNISSLAAFQPGPFMNVYYASKAYVLSFSEALAEELRGSKITVTALCPGPLATDFWKTSGSKRNHVPATTKATRLDPKFVAQMGYKGLLAGKLVIIPGILNKFIVFFNHFIPRRIVARIVKRLNEKF